MVSFRHIPNVGGSRYRDDVALGERLYVGLVVFVVLVTIRAVTGTEGAASALVVVGLAVLTAVIGLAIFRGGHGKRREVPSAKFPEAKTARKNPQVQQSGPSARAAKSAPPAAPSPEISPEAPARAAWTRSEIIAAAGVAVSACSVIVVALK